jgi:hypothetical protein
MALLKRGAALLGVDNPFADSRQVGIVIWGFGHNLIFRFALISSSEYSFFLI